MSQSMYRNLILIAICLAFVVVTLGAYVRLSDAGLGCPDWPGCYGQLLVPSENTAIDEANASYPERPFESGKAWKEMVHRYAAGALLLLVFSLTYLSWKSRGENSFAFKISISLMVLIIFQALLGMWTVTLLLKPVVVMAHLLGGMTVLLLLTCLLWSVLKKDHLLQGVSTSLPRFALLGLLVLYLQILLGGWTSANYAALICPDLPVCRGDGMPEMDIKQGFTFWTGVGRNYEFGLLDAEARTAIHVIHRAGAVVTFLVLSLLSVVAILSQNRVVKLFGISTFCLLCLQFCLGLLNIIMNLPIYIAVAHNGVAALLLISVGAVLYHSLRYQQTTIRQI